MASDLASVTHGSNVGRVKRELDQDRIVSVGQKLIQIAYDL